MPSTKPRFTFRSDKETLKKLEYIATTEKRSLNQQLEKVVCDFINRYEYDHGEIKIDQDPEN